MGAVGCRDWSETARIGDPGTTKSRVNEKGERKDGRGSETSGLAAKDNGASGLAAASFVASGLATKDTGTSGLAAGHFQA